MKLCILTPMVVANALLFEDFEPKKSLGLWVGLCVEKKYANYEAC